MNVRGLDLNLLLLLDSLLSSRNLSAAARSLGMSQPTASDGLSKLRHFFKDELFVRTGRGLRPTPFAEELQGPVRRVFEQINNEILTRATFVPHESHRTFKIMMADLSEVIFLPPIVKRLRAEAPHINIKCVKVPLADLANALENGTVDLAIGYFANLRQPAIRSQLLYREAFACIARIGHPKAREGLSAQEFRNLDHLAFEPQGQEGAMMDWGKKIGLKYRTSLQIPHYMSVPLLVAATDLVSIVPRLIATLFATPYGLIVIEPPVGLPSLPMMQFWHRRLQNDPALVWLRELVFQAASTSALLAERRQPQT